MEECKKEIEEMERPEYKVTGKFVQVFLPRDSFLAFAKLCLETGRTRQAVLLEAVEAKLEKERRPEHEE